MLTLLFHGKKSLEVEVLDGKYHETLIFTLMHHDLKSTALAICLHNQLDPFQ
jgi:hypothetical protein